MLKTKSKIINILILCTVAAFFIGKRAINSLNNDEVTNNPYLEKIIESVFVPGILAMCIKKFDEKDLWINAGQSWNTRNRDKSLDLAEKIKQSGGLDKSYKDSIDKLAYKKINQYFQDNIASSKDCDDFALDVDKKKYDLL